VLLGVEEPLLGGELLGRRGAQLLLHPALHHPGSDGVGAQTAVPFLERQGWKLSGAFVQRSGRLGNVIDVWELEDFQHYDRALQALMADAAFPAFKKVLEETVISETVVFANRASYMHA